MIVIAGRLQLHFKQILALGFGLIILAGALLLTLPAANREGVSLPFVDALFTAVSATCVTGLAVADTYTQFSAFGQAVILLLIQTGGLGFMTVAILVPLALGKRIGLKERGLLMESVNTPQLGGVVRLVRHILIGTFFFEGIGVILLSLRFCPIFGLGQGLWMGVFHAVSAFCNAGFDLMGRLSPGSSLTAFAGDPLVNLVIAGLIIIGGIGFIVWEDVWQNRFRFARYRLHTKIVLCVTAALLVLPTLLFYFLERGHAFAGMSGGGKWLAAFFQAVTPRTAGYNTVDMASLSPGGSFLTMALMFTGASPGSTGGGIKTTTLLVVLLSLASHVRHQNESLNIFHRRLEPEVLRQAYCGMSLYLLLVAAGCFTLCAFGGFAVEDSLFEAVSAIGTVGLSRGITSQLNGACKAAVMLLMYIGRLGSLSVAIAVAGRKREPQRLKNPEEKITVG